jgi:hypothetical protein
VYPTAFRRPGVGESEEDGMRVLPRDAFRLKLAQVIASYNPEIIPGIAKWDDWPAADVQDYLEQADEVMEWLAGDLGAKLWN